MGKTVFDFYSAEIAQNMTNDDLEVLKSGCPKLGIIEQYESASGLRWVQTDKVPIIDENGIPKGIIGFAQDITERKKAEEKILWLASFPMLNPNPVLEVSFEGNISYLNSAAESVFPDLKKADLSHPLFSGWNDLLATFRNEKTQTLGRNIKIKDNWFRQQFNVHIETQQVRIYVTNITKTILAEKALLEYEAKFRIYMENSPVAVFVANTEGKYEYVNEAASKLLGYSTKELMGMSIQQVTFVGEPKVFSAVKNTGCASCETVLRSKDGLPVFVILNSVRLPDGKLMAFCENITERKKKDLEIKQKNEALVQERDMLESVTAASGAGLVIISKDYHVQWANDFIKRYKGDTIGKLCYASLNSLDSPCQDCGVAKIYAGKTTLDSHEYCSTTVDGNPYWVEIVATPLTDEKGNVTSAVEICVDITERKKNEEKLKESIHKNELVNEKLSVVGSLTRHDVGNKLMVVKSNIYLLKKQFGDNPKLAQYLEKIDTAIKSSDEMFEFSRFYEKIGAEEPSKANIAQCFNQAATLLPSLGTIKIVNDCQGLEVMADSLLKQLFYNFLDNSLKHGEKVTQIRLYYTNEGDRLKLFYEDNGLGISEANKPKLFHEGFSTGKSTGLGLFLIKKMVEVYGWTISKEGEPGKGAKFTITIPKLNKNGKENYRQS